MAVPDVSKDIVISDPDIIELVAVSVTEEPAFSSILVVLVASVTVGAASLSIIVISDDVIVVVHSLLSGLIAFKLRTTVSLISEIESSVGVKEKVSDKPDIEISGIVS